MSKLYLASRNANKVDEFRRLLPGIEIETLPLSIELPPEDGDTYVENALGKARAAYSATGVAGFGDDSGIEAECLGGRPGVRSARFAGIDARPEENVDKFIREVIPGSKVEFVCVLAYVSAGGEQIFSGRCIGKMAESRRGDGGFGYDPVFIPSDDPNGRTMAELSTAEKDWYSHRGIAARELFKFID